jgi:hypothetical protein
METNFIIIKEVPTEKIKWCAIDSAPKDGSTILLYCDNEETAYTGFWDDHINKWQPIFLDYHVCCCIEGCCCGIKGCDRKQPVPTHWIWFPEYPE